MVIMTDGLRALAGNAIRAGLMRFTRNPVTGAITGAISTAILQSSSATTVAVVGFVGAGLMAFPEALGIIFGANIGTTIKGWVIVLLGFEFNLGTYVLPFIFVGAILRLFSNGRLAMVGYAIAGFGLIFVGITVMQEGMSHLQNMIRPELLPEDSFTGRIKLVALGMVVTAITQSSSAGVVATLTALYAGAINFHQAAALVIGMDVGTTVTALMATIGGSLESRRTGISHVIYNFCTGAGALVLISPYIWLWEISAPGAILQHAEIALVAFHNLFNFLGVVIVLPFTRQFAALIIKIVPGDEPGYTRKLDPVLIKQPEIALSVLLPTIRAELFALLTHIGAILNEAGEGKSVSLTELQQALDRTDAFIDKIQLKPAEGTNWQCLVALVHTLDHLQRLHERCEEEEDRAITARKTIDLAENRNLLITTIYKIMEDFENNRPGKAAHRAEKTANVISQQEEVLRENLMNKVASGMLDIPETTEYLEAIRWLRRVSKHIARITYHYNQAILSIGQ
jgi:phosphate:Na+ symporter